MPKKAHLQIRCDEGLRDGLRTAAKKDGTTKPLSPAPKLKPKIGRPSMRTPDLVEEFCARIASGRSVKDVCSDSGMPCQDVVYRWLHEDMSFAEKLSRAREERREATRTFLNDLSDRVLEDNSLDPQRANVAGSLRYKAELLMAPKQRVELTGRNGRPNQMDDGGHDLMTMARKVALAFRLIAMHDAEAGLSEDVGDGKS